MSIKNTLKEIVKNSLKDICEIDIEQIKIEIPKNNQYGDYYTDIPILLTKKLKKTPLDIAKLIIKNLNNEQLIEKTEILDQGFITFYLKKEYLLININTILEKKIIMAETILVIIKKLILILLALILIKY